MATTYEDRVAAQIEQYRKGINVYELPAVFHYWSNKYLRPKITDLFGAESIPEFFALPIIEKINRQKRSVRILSIGSGDCSVEVAVAKIVREHTQGEFVILATELSPNLIETATASISSAGLSANITCQKTDLNTWQAQANTFDVAMASHSLHHLVELEHIFTNVHRALRPDGVFCISDMIGRNGHMRWPEALEPLQKLWALLPSSHRYNHIIERVEPEYINFDCSSDGFEGIRAQDILPLLLQNFYPGKFLCAGGLTDVFIDRAFGHNFDVNRPFDKGFIDLVHHINDLMLRTGAITPTQMFAYFYTEDPGGTVEWAGTSPDRAIRWPYGLSS